MLNCSIWKNNTNSDKPEVVPGLTGTIMFRSNRKNGTLASAAIVFRTLITTAFPQPPALPIMATQIFETHS